MTATPASYFDTSTWDSRYVVTGGSRMFTLDMPSGLSQVFNKRVG